MVLVPAPRPTADPPPVVLKSASVGFPEAKCFFFLVFIKTPSVASKGSRIYYEFILSIQDLFRYLQWLSGIHEVLMDP